MKSLKILFSVLVLSVIASSCSSADDPLARVKYQISGLDSDVAQIKYKNALGGTNDILLNGDINKFAGGSDSKTMAVNFLPFDASLEVTVNNTSLTVKHYILVIYVDNVVKATTYLDAPASAITTELVDYTAEN